MAENALAPRTYAELRRRVQTALLVGQRQIEAAKVRTYWETGRLISEHLRLHEQRPEYGTEVMLRLANDLEIHQSVLYRCVGFARAFPIFATWRKLTWAHYRLLIQVEDKKQRRALTVEADRKGWTVRQLVEHLRPIALLKGSSNGNGAGSNGSGTHKPLVPKRGTVGIYQIVANGDSLALDLGFTSYLDLTEAQARGLKAGSLVRLESNGNITKAKDAQTSDLFTYRAEVIRVVDGDTLWMKIYLRPRHWLKEKLRLRGLDCPEMDTPEGQAAKRFVQALVNQATSVTITTTKPDKYDRYLSDIYLETNAGSLSAIARRAKADLSADLSADLFLNNLLLENGHAVRKDSYELFDWEPRDGTGLTS